MVTPMEENKGHYYFILLYSSGVKMDWAAIHPTALLAGYSLNTVQLVDIHKKKVLHEISEQAGHKGDLVISSHVL